MKAAPANTRCRYCDAALDALTRRRGADICGAARCRHDAAQAHSSKLREALRITAPAAACSQLPHLQEAPAVVVWLQHCETQTIAVTEDEREHHRAYLESVVADSMVIDYSRLAEFSAAEMHPHGARLCGECRGRCCQAGAGWGAFIDLTVLQRWQQEQPECSLADAVEAYLSMLPEKHVQGSCLYLTAAGCAMPRERRADICNGFACDALTQVQRAVDADPARSVLAIKFHRDTVERAAVIEADATYALALESPAA
jgi:hypothetical protein